LLRGRKYYLNMTTTSEKEEYDYLFGFGSIMNSSTHAPWLKDESVGALLGAVATLSRGFGYERQWNFRSSTGFTALGVIESTTPNDINGVVFRVPRSMMPSFDRREAGYTKVRVPLESLQFQPELKGAYQQTNFELTNGDNVWLYVPSETHCAHADENHPLLQSYVDTVLQGCLEWGGDYFAEQFLVLTGGWATYFLNDTPNSRRPWLFRKDYDIIDRLLQKHSSLTHYGDRRHPEEFASAFHRRMKGTWSIPRRNPNFTGRDHELQQILTMLSNQNQVVAKLQVAGMGGVGKTQICAEYCYRHFSSLYGLVVWLNAESQEALVADYRQLLLDLAAEAEQYPNKDTDEIVGEVKTRLFRSQVPWLLVFDNLEDVALLDKFCPRGAGHRGHVLVTTRVVDALGSGLSTFVLGCFSPSESLQLLQRAAGARNMKGDDNARAAGHVCERLGHLPLALGMAAAYMQRCDVTCVEYLERYLSSEKSGSSLLRHGKLHDYALSVAASLSLSLVAIEKESVIACDIVRLLSFLGPDQITKALIRSLLSAKDKSDQEVEEDESKTSSVPIKSMIIGTSALVLGVALSKKGGNRKGAGVMAILMLTTASALAMFDISMAKSSDAPFQTKQKAERVGAFSATEYEQADLVWNILKSFSILTVKEGKGSLHRLLAQALRESQSEELYRRDLKICVEAMDKVWIFRPENPDTWQDSLFVLEHLKAVVSHSVDYQPSKPSIVLTTGRLSKEAGVFSAMALNAFMEAQASLDLSLKILQNTNDSSKPSFQRARAESLHELGRVLRYQGNYSGSEKALRQSLDIRKQLARKEYAARQGVADTLHELGALEVKKHNLDSAATFLHQSLDMRRSMDKDILDINADCAATLHQLAAVYVARKPPSLDRAEALLQEALGLSRQIGQRAATLKQLARVTIRQGLLDRAETYLEQALELYVELYGDNKLHINIAAVKFQQGALATQCEQLEQAWDHFSECLRIRRHVYAYTRPIQGSTAADDNPTHLEVSCVLHELGCVAFAQGWFSQSCDMLKAEGAILERLQETSTQTESLFQARLTNLTWRRKCAKQMDQEEEATRLTRERTNLKIRAKQETKEETNCIHADTIILQQEAVECRLLARQFALGNIKEKDSDRDELEYSLTRLMEEMKVSPPGSMKRAATQFCHTIVQNMNVPVAEKRSAILKSCDALR
jgi:tetratricopeptide (TPR) repeat protein